MEVELELRYIYSVGTVQWAYVFSDFPFMSFTL